MSRLQNLIFYLLLTIFLAVISVNAQNIKSSDNNDFTNYEIMQYITTTGGSPEQIIKMDNNSIILMNCIDGKNISQLRDAGINLNDSQIELLKDWRLLKKEKNIYRTNFQIIDTEQTEKLRKHTKTIASSLGNLLKNDIIELNDVLKKANREKNAYSILFSYVIDGLVWDEFEKQGMIDEKEVTIEHPFWDGEIWAISPKREFSCGTNTISDEGVKLSINWSKGALKNMLPFVSDWKNLSKLFDDYIKSGKVIDPDAKKAFAPYGLYNMDGLFSIPVIVEEKGNPLFDICRKITDDIIKKVRTEMHLNSLKKEFGFRDNKQTLIIVYHEIMWDLLDYFENEGLITKPVAFADPDHTSPEDISSLTFFVKTVKNSSN